MNRLRRIILENNNSGGFFEFCFFLDFLVVILFCFVLKDNIWFFVVCKIWGEIVVFVRVRDLFCWFMYFDLCCNLYGFFDLIEKKKIKVMMVDLFEFCYIFYFNDGWLFMEDRVLYVRFFFFNFFI